MSLILPYFKLDVIDWLKSEKIEQMSTACIGAYILLLCEAWTRPSCSLPSATLALMKLGRWTDTEEAFAPVRECFKPYKGDATRLINPRLKKEWDEAHARIKALSEAGKRGAQIKQALHHHPKRTMSRPLVASQEFEQFWQAYPKKIGKKAALQAWQRAVDKPQLVDIIHSIEKSKKTEQWTKENGQYIPNPSTWLNQGRWTDQPMLNGSVLHDPTLCTQCVPPKHIPAEKRKEHDFTRHPKFVG